MDRKQRTFDAGSCKALANLAVVAGRDLERTSADQPWSAALSKVPQRTGWPSKTVPSASDQKPQATVAGGVCGAEGHRLPL